MGRAPWKVRDAEAVDTATSHNVDALAHDELDLDRRMYLERLKAEIAAGTYRISAESLAAKLVRRIRWW